MRNKRGQVTMFLLVGLLIVFVGAIVLIVLGFFSTNLNNALSGNIQAGQVNLSNYSSLTIGKFNTMVVNNADLWGVGLIVGMMLGLWAGAYFTRGKFPLLGILIDIGIIFLAFLISLYLKSIYSSVVVALSAAGQDFATTYLTKTNFFILNLPLFIAIIGVVAMVLFHMRLPPKAEELDLTTGVASA